MGKVVIAGGSGFLGSILAKLYENTHSITIGDLSAPPNFLNKSNIIELVYEKVRIIASRRFRVF